VLAWLPDRVSGSCSSYSASLFDVNTVEPAEPQRSARVRIERRGAPPARQSATSVEQRPPDIPPVSTVIAIAHRLEHAAEALRADRISEEEYTGTWRREYAHAAAVRPRTW
jgi:hypothetical protein